MAIPEHTEIEITINDYVVDFTGDDEQFEFTDFKGKPFVQEHENCFGKAFLTLGG